MISGLKAIQDEIGIWSRKNFGTQAAYRPLLGAVEETGELCHAQLKMEQGIRTNEDHTSDAKDAIGDILIYLMNYCAIRGFNIEDIVETTWEEVRNRDWAKNKENGKI